MIWLVAINDVPLLCALCDQDLDGPGRGGRCDCDHHVDCCPFLAAIRETREDPDADQKGTSTGRT